MRIVVADLHRSTAEYETRANQGGIAHLLGFGARLFHGASDGVGRLFEAKGLQELLEFFTIFRRFDRIDRCANNGDIGCCQSPCKIEWSLSTKLNNDSIWLDAVANVEHVFGGQRFKEQDVAGVVVGADRFWVAIDHDRFNTHLAQGETGMAAAVIKLDSLTNTIGASP